MRRLTEHMKRAAVAVPALLFSTFAGAQQASPPPTPSPTPAPRAVEARADQEMKRMSEFLAKLPHFALEAEESFDEIPNG